MRTGVIWSVLAIFGLFLCVTGAATAAVRGPSMHGIRPHVEKFFNGYENELACASASDCTAVTAKARYSFNPTRAGKVRHVRTDQTGGYYDQLGIACASATKCVEVDATGKVEVFDPKSTAKAAKFTMGGLGGQTAVACPSKNRCVVESYQGESVFNPGHVGKPTTTSFTANGTGADEIISCPSFSYCVGSNGTGNGGVGQVYTYNPTAANKAAVHSLKTTPELGPVSCVSGSSCVALASPKRNPSLNTALVRFNPHHPGSPKVTPLTESSLDVLVCHSKTLCAAVGNQGGVLIFNPKKPGHSKHLVFAPYDNDFVGLAFLGSSKLVLLAATGGKAVIDPMKPPKSVKPVAFGRAAKVKRG
jgi:hypothetical protein